MRLCLILLYFVLAACQDTHISQNLTNPDGQLCKADSLQHLVGLDASDLVAEEFENPVRIFNWNDAVTLDFAANRLNIVIGKDGAVAKLYCG